MNSEKLTEPTNSPSSQEVESFIGEKNYALWKKLSEWISVCYPEMFSPEWIRSGEKAGWYLRYKKSKSFCQFIPRRDQFIVLVTFGKNEREKVEIIMDQLSPRTQIAYNDAETFHDGKWLYLIVSDHVTVSDLQELLATKRKIKKP